MSKKEKVYEVYNKIGAWFDSVRSQDLKMENKYLDSFLEGIPAGGNILDLGCGSGRPIAQYFLQKGYRVKGIDGSVAMVDMAKKYVPEIEPEVQDMRNLVLKAKFNGILMWHSSFHLPAEDQRRLIAKLPDFLNAQGRLMFTSGPHCAESWGDNNGEQLYHASLSQEEYREILTDAGFKVLSLDVSDPTAGGATVWLCQLR
jgi:ubiquinone/menaquinone biosynthesis C-methylase UbiE